MLQQVLKTAAEEEDDDEEEEDEDDSEEEGSEEETDEGGEESSKTAYDLDASFDVMSDLDQVELSPAEQQKLAALFADDVYVKAAQEEADEEEEDDEDEMSKKAAFLLQPQPRKENKGVTAIGDMSRVASQRAKDPIKVLEGLWETRPDVSDFFKN
jgi:hypothetical protein